MNAPTRRKVAYAAIALGIAALVVLFVSSFVTTARLSTQIRDTQIEGTPTGKRIVEISEQIESCTTPGSDCYEENLKRTAEAVSDINEITVAAVACADRPEVQTIEQVQRCVIDYVTANERPRD